MLSKALEGWDTEGTMKVDPAGWLQNAPKTKYFFEILLDEVGEEESGVTDDASSPGLFMLTALQGETVVHVALRM